MAGEEGLVWVNSMKKPNAEPEGQMGNTARNTSCSGQNTFQKMLDDIAPYAQMEEVRPATR